MKIFREVKGLPEELKNEEKLEEVIDVKPVEVKEEIVENPDNKETMSSEGKDDIFGLNSKDN